MPKSSRGKTKTAQSIVPTSQKQDAIDRLLQKMLDAFPAKGTITPDEIADWHRDLNPFSLEAIEFAFDSHRRNAIFFPIYGQIIDLCISYDPPGQQLRTTARCDDECKSRHHKGYSEVDVKHLWELYEKRREMVQHPMTEEEIEILLCDLDKKRGSKPEWRRIGAA